jgi:hypothetical protein
MALNKESHMIRTSVDFGDFGQFPAFAFRFLFRRRLLERRRRRDLIDRFLGPRMQHRSDHISTGVSRSMAADPELVDVLERFLFGLLIGRGGTLPQFLDRRRIRR